MATQHDTQSTHFIDLLDVELEELYTQHPNRLVEIVNALPETVTHVVLDEILKVPKLLDIVHSLIEKTKKCFVLSGSSARKLKRGGANLLAGRAFVYHLHALSYLELGQTFELGHALQWGMLPKAWLYEEAEFKKQFLQAYTRTYLKDEVWDEHFVRNLEPFRKFLEASAQCSGKIINFSNIAKDVGVDDKTVKEYYTLLEDTLLGFFLEGFQHSFRKRLSTKPKFYYFDVGVVRALTRQLTLPVQAGTSYYGDFFEQFIILECMKLASYHFSEYQFSYLKTKDDSEIDLIVDRPGQPHLFIEIKSSTNVKPESLRSLINLSQDFKDCEAVCFSQDPTPRCVENVTIYPWKMGVEKYFGATE